MFNCFMQGTVPHAPFSLPNSLLANTSATPAGDVAPDPAWAAAREVLLSRLRRCLNTTTLIP